MKDFRLLALLSLGAFLFVGCGGVQPSSQQQTTPPQVVAHKSGVVLSGETPIIGATIQLYATGDTGLGSPSTALLTPSTVTDVNGNFDLTGLYTCPSQGLLYIAATGGHVGSLSTNPNLALITTIGACSTLTSSSFTTLNERTTVAAVSALAGFISSVSAVGLPSPPQNYFPYVFLLSSYFADPATSATPGNNLPLNTSISPTLINTLSNIIATCVDSSGGVAGDSTPCGKLFSLTTPSGAVAPTDTVAALRYLETDTTLAANSPALFSLTSTGAPFQPQLSQAPANFGVVLTSAFQEFFTPDTNVVFPQTSVGATSAPITITVSTLSGGPVGRPLVAQLLNPGGPFTITPTICPNSNSQVCTFSVTFTPTDTSRQQATLSITDPTSQGSGISASLQGNY